MRNLKKILALVLALVMSLSLMATASAAGTTAAAETDAYATAKEVLEGLKVFKGDAGTGNMRYTDPISRVETAALVYRICTGDVEDAKAGLHTNHPFKDVASDFWGTSYISYGHNAGILKGKGANNFDPFANVTGYETLAMMLRAMGYGRNGEFEGAGWEVRTASTAQSLGLLKNVTPSDSARLGQPASRELVAEILFRAILKNKVMFSALNPYNYTELNEKLADNLALTEVKGVVIANEYANLDTASTLGAGKTLLRGEKDYTISKSTDLDAIGESRLAYLQNGTTVLAISDGKAENKTAETTDAKKLDALLGDAGLSAPAQSGKFINFGKGTGRYSEYKIQYVLKYKLDADGKAKADLAAERINYAAGTTITAKEVLGYWTVTRTIAPKEDITSVDIDNMSAIFGKADRTDKDVWTTIANGEVYVGTQSYEDISDNLKYSYDKFYSEFILERKDTDFSANENGNWMKVIDNDLDGKADYALKVIYTFAQVTAAKDGAYTLDVKNHTLDTPAGVCGIDKINNVTSETVVSNSGELAVGDIVYYANIDGKVQAYKAEMKTVSFNDVNRNNKTAVTTDGETLTQSGVCEHISDAAYESGVVNLAGKVSYDIYLDRGGYLGAFTKTTATGQFKLVTDGWYNSVKVGTDYAIKVYNDETGRQDTIDIPNNGSLFIGSGRTDDNAWGALKSLPSLNDSKQHKNLTTGSYVNDDTVRTTVVALASDNSILPVEDGSVAGRYDHVMIDLSNANGESFIPTRTPVTGNAYITTTGSQTAYNHNNGPVELRALTSTVYYLVYRDQANGAYQVTRTVGYDSAPDVTALAKKGYVEDIYAVGTRHVTNNDLTGATAFYTADVVVIELNQYDYHNELIMVVDDEARLTDVRYRDLTVIRADGTTGNLTIDYSASMLHDYGYIDGKAGQKIVEPGLYWLYKTSTEGIYTISKRLDANQIAASGHIAAGQVKQYDYINGQEYVALRSFTTDNLDLIHNTRGANYNAAAVIDNTVETTYTLTSDIPMYTLSYNVGHDDTLVAYRTSGKASLTSTTHSTALAGQVNIVPRDNVNTADREGTDSANWNRYNYNDVMIFFNGSRAVYAVSFENIRTDNGGIKNGTTWNFAQTVWENVLPSKHVYTTVAPEVHLFGETGPALTAGVTTPIPYSVWSKFDVTGTDVPVTVFARPAVGSNNEIAVEGSTGWSDTAVTVSDLLDTDRTKLAMIASGLTDSINVQSRAKTGGAVSQNWNFGYYLVPANDDATLRYEDGREVPNPIPDTQEIGNLRSFIEKHKVPAGATATWNVTDKISGETYTIVVTDNGIDESRTNLPKNISFMHEVKDFYVKVVAENGVTEKEYSENAPAPAPQVTFTVKNAAITVDDNDVADGEKVTAQVGDVLTIKVTPVPATNDTITVKADGTAVTAEEDGSYKVTVTGDMAVSVETSDSAVPAAKATFTLDTASADAAEWYWEDPDAENKVRKNVELKIAAGTEYAVGDRIAVADFISLPELPTTGDAATTDWDVEFTPSASAHYDYTTNEIVVDASGAITVKAKCYDQKWNSTVSVGGDTGSGDEDDEYQGGISTQPPQGAERPARLLSRPAPGSKVTFYTGWISNTREVSRIVCNEASLAETDWEIKAGTGDNADKFYVIMQVPFTTGNYDIHVYLKSAASYTLTLTKAADSKRTITSLPVSAKANAAGEVSFDVTVQQYYEPRVTSVTKAADSAAFDEAPVITYAVKDEAANVWTVTMTGVTADAKATVAAVKNVVVTLKGTDNEATPATAEAAVNGDVATFTVTMNDTTHYPKVTAMGITLADDAISYARVAGTKDWVVTIKGINASCVLTLANSSNELRNITITPATGFTTLVFIPAGKGSVTANPDGTFKVEGIKVDSAYVPTLTGKSSASSGPLTPDTSAITELKYEKVGETYTISGKIVEAQMTNKSNLTIEISATNSQLVNLVLEKSSVVTAAGAAIQGEAMQAVQNGKVKYTVVTNEGYYPTVDTTANSSVLANTKKFVITSKTADGKTTWTLEIAVKASGNLTMGCTALPKVRLNAADLPTGVTADVTEVFAVPVFNKNGQDSTTPGSYTAELVVNAAANAALTATAAAGSSWTVDGTPSYKDGKWTIKLTDNTAEAGLINITATTKKAVTLVVAEADKEIMSIKGDATKYDNQSDDMTFTVLVDETYELDSTKFTYATPAGGVATATATAVKGAKDDETGKIAWTVTVAHSVATDVNVTLAAKQIEGLTVLLSGDTANFYIPADQQKHVTATGTVEATIYMKNGKFLKVDTAGVTVAAIAENDTATARDGFQAYDVTLNVTGTGLVTVTLTAVDSALDRVGCDVASGESSTITGATWTDADKTLKLGNTTVATAVAEASPAKYEVKCAVEVLKGYKAEITGTGFTIAQGSYDSGSPAAGYNVWIITWTGEADAVDTENNNVLKSEVTATLAVGLD